MVALREEGKASEGKAAGPRGRRMRKREEERELEHTSAVRFNLRGNIFIVRWLSSVFYKVVTKVALIFALAASYWQSARPRKYCSTGLI